MKTHRILVIAAALLAAATITAGAEGISLEVGGWAYDFNALSALQTPAPATTVTNNADFSPDPYINGSYTLKIDDATKLKLGLMAEDMMGTISPSFVSIARAEPYVDLSMGALSARVSLPLYFLGYDTTNDPKYAEIKYILDKDYKGINLSTWYNSSNTFLFTNYESVAYKFAFDKATALTLSASTEIGFSPAVWVYDVKPQVSFVWGPLQLDVKESIYFSNQLASSATAAQAICRPPTPLQYPLLHRPEAHVRLRQRRSEGLEGLPCRFALHGERERGRRQLVRNRRPRDGNECIPRLQRYSGHQLRHGTLLRRSGVQVLQLRRQPHRRHYEEGSDLRPCCKDSLHVRVLDPLSHSTAPPATGALFLPA